MAVPSATRPRRNAIIDQLESLPVRVRTLPGVSDLAQGKVQVEDLREVDIEDLLGRDPVPPDSGLLGATIAGKVVLVSGAGGSIGSELCRQIVQLRPAALVLYEHGEYALYAIEQELLRLSAPVALPIYPVLGSVVDQARMVRNRVSECFPMAGGRNQTRAGRDCCDLASGTVVRKVGAASSGRFRLTASLLAGRRLSD